MVLERNKGMYPNLYQTFSREQWAELRGKMPLELSTEDLDALRGTNDPVTLDEVTAIYLPIARLLNIHMAAAEGLGRVKDAFLGRLATNRTYIIAVTGSVAVGKSTFSRVLREVLSRWIDRPRVDLVTTDGFLYPNRVLEQRGLMDRKGFPESYDLHSLVEFLISVKRGEDRLRVPVYSHHVYDIVPDEWQEIERPDILILEGLNLLQSNKVGGRRAPIVFVSDLLDFSIYVDAQEPHIRQWYIERFLTLKATAFKQPSSYFHRYASLTEQEAREFATSVWERINLANLVENVAPTRERAQLVLQKAADHKVQEVWLRSV